LHIVPLHVSCRVSLGIPQILCLCVRWGGVREGKTGSEGETRKKNRVRKRERRRTVRFWGGRRRLKENMR
jgi:hypothetical protein